MWVISEITPEFEIHMFDVLEVYERLYNPLYPVVCFDELSKQLLAEIRKSLPMRFGKLRRYDYEYERNGTVNLFVAIEPKGKKRHVFVTKHRTKQDFARVVKILVTKIYKGAMKVILVLDNLNTHNKQTLIEVLGEKEGKKIARRIEWHYTPKHGSWLNQAEIENHVLSQQCLARRIPTFQTMQHEVAAWVNKRNEKGVGINWQFTREKAIQKFMIS